MPKIKKKKNTRARKARQNPACVPAPQGFLSRFLPRRLDRALRRTRVRQALGMTVITLSLLGSLHVLGGIRVIEDQIAETWNAARNTAYDRSGLRLARVLVAGRQQVAASELAEQSGLNIGVPVLDIDVTDVQQKILGLTWVRDAQVRIQWPDTVRIDITERHPVAVWQQEGEFILIDEEGVALGLAEWPRDDNLPRVVGNGANVLVTEVISLLDNQPEIGPLIEAAVRIRDRRWNLRLWNGVDILLPEENAKQVLADFVAWELENRILEKDIRIVDLRQPDRWFARVSPGGAALMRTPGKDT